jgi:DNA-binding NarL/FixJ family response regulator
LNHRGDNPIHILVIAASSDRRANLVARIVQAVHARTTTLSLISLPRILEIAADILLMDVDSPAMSAETVRALKDLPAGSGFIALADHPDSHWVSSALRAGVNAILSREMTLEELRVAIMAAESGLVLLHPSSAHMLAHNSLAQNDSPEFIEALTAREQEVLRLASEGLGNKEIAGRLNISEHTVKFHISSILGKLGAASRTEAVSQGIRRGLIIV